MVEHTQISKNVNYIIISWPYSSNAYIVLVNRLENHLENESTSNINNHFHQALLNKHLPFQELYS